MPERLTPAEEKTVRESAAEDLVWPGGVNFSGYAVRGLLAEIDALREECARLRGEACKREQHEEAVLIEEHKWR